MRIIDVHLWNRYRVPARLDLPFGAAPLMDAQRAMGMVRHMAHGGKVLLITLAFVFVAFLGRSSLHEAPGADLYLAFTRCSHVACASFQDSTLHASGSWAFPLGRT